MLRILSGSSLAAGPVLTEVQPRLGISGREDRFAQLICMAAEEIHRFGPLEDQMNDHPIRVLRIRLQSQPDAAEFVRRKGDLGLAIASPLQGCHDACGKMGHRADRRGPGCRGSGKGRLARGRKGNGAKITVSEGKLDHLQQ